MYTDQLPYCTISGSKINKLIRTDYYFHTGRSSINNAILDQNFILPFARVLYEVSSRLRVHSDQSARTCSLANLQPMLTFRTWLHYEIKQCAGLSHRGWFGVEGEREVRIKTNPKNSPLPENPPCPQGWQPPLSIYPIPNCGIACDVNFYSATTTIPVTLFAHSIPLSPTEGVRLT